MLISILYALIILIASLIFLSFWILIKNKPANFSEIITIISVLFFTLLPLIAIYQAINLKFGQTGSILAGVFITLATILLGTTGLGSLIWRYLPFVWPVKLLYLLAQANISLKISWIYIGLSLVITIICLHLTSSFFKNWDVYQKTEN